jgi:hypothetical protein
MVMSRSSRFAPSLVLLVLVLVMTLAGCIPVLNADRAWVKYPTQAPPDRTCATGYHALHVYYVWTCTEGEHVVVSQFLSGLGPTQARREAVRCGELTPFESSPEGRWLVTALKDGTCQKVPSGFEWGASVR